jgi:cell wall-associated NlpC family hydrolase
MSDGSLGWLRRESIRLLEYQVVSDSTASGPASGNFTGDYSDGLPASKGVYFHGDPQALFREAYKYLGVPYHWGGNTASGIDCSAFVKNVFEANGYPLPRHSSDQTAYGLAVPKEALAPGDRLYFGTPATRSVTHCGLYLGNGYFIHSSSNRHGVAVSQLSEPLYEKMYICARR